MPQLQNNNRTPLKTNYGNAPRNNSYINEAKVTKDYNQQSNYESILKGVNDIMNFTNSKLQEFVQKTQQVETENIFNEYKTEFDNITKEYKFNYEREPSEELTKEYENNLQLLKDNYEKKTPSLYKNNFLQRVDLINRQNHMDFFRKIADLNYQSNKYMESLNNSLNIINNASYEGNFEAMADEINNLPLKKQQLIGLYGDLQGNQIYNDYTKRLIKSFMGGRIASNNPDDVLDITQVIEMSPEFNNKLTAEELEHYKQIALDKKDRIEKTRKTKEMTEYAIKTNIIVNDIANQRLNNYEDIVNALLVTGAGEYESKLIMKLAGYSTELPAELLNKNRENKEIRTLDEKEINRKKTDTERQEKAAIIKQKIFSLYEGIDDKELVEESDRKTIANRIKDLNDTIMEATAFGYITKEENAKFLEQITPYYTKVLDATAKGNFNDDGGWLHFEIGYSDLKKEIKNVLKINELDVDNPEELKNKFDKEKYYFLINHITDNFIKDMNRQYKIIKNNDINGKYKDVNNWIELQNKLDYNDRKQMYKTAITNAKIKLVRDEYGVNSDNFVDKNGNLIDENVLNNIFEEEQENKQIENFLYERQEIDSDGNIITD